MLKKILKNKVIWLGLFLLSFLLSVNSSQAAPSLGSRLSGYILLQVESLGEAWYVIPKEQQRVYMKDGAVAYQIMREVSLGITNANLAKIPVGIEARFNDVDTDSDGLSDNLEKGLDTDPNKADTDNDGFSDGEEIKNNYSPLGPNKLSYDNTLVNRLKGYILLQVEKQGQAWYVNPKDGKRYYMQDGPAAYNIMRYLSLGITNKNLDLIPKSSRVFKVDTSNNSSNQGNQNNQGNQGNNNNSTSTPPGNSGNQGGNSGGGGGGGNNHQPSADTQSPSIPTNLSASASGTSISLSWTASTDNIGVVGYQILRSTTNGSGYTQIATSNTTSYNNTGLNIGTTYYYVVKAYDAAGNVSGSSAQAQATSIDNQAPSMPSGLNATASGSQISLSWTASTDNVGVTQYIIERSDSAISGYTQIATSTTSVYVNTRLAINSTYYYRVRAQDLAGNYSAYSEIASATTNNALVVTDTQSPSIPTNLSASASGTSISLSWTASTDNIGVVGYQILRSTTNGSGYTQIATSNTTSYNNTGLNIGTTYYYVVKAYDAAGNVSGSSAQAQATVPVPVDTQNPTAPSSLTATAANREVALSWTASSDNVGVVGYQVFRSTINGSGYVQQVTVNTTVYVDTNLTNGTTYYYVVKAYDAAGNVSGSSAQAQATPADIVAPSAPSNLNTSVSGTTVSLSWSASTDNVAVSQYLIERSTSASSGFTQIATSNTTSYSDSGLSAGTYYYVVKAYDAAGNTSSNSNQATATITTQSDTIAPSTPTNLSASASGTTISLLWSASTDNIGVARYLVERSTSASSGFTQIATPTTNSYTDSGLANSTTYYYRIRAQDNANNTSNYSSTANATTGSASVNTINLIQNSWDFSSTAWDGDALGANPWSPKANFTFTSGQSDPFGTSKAFRVALSTSNRPYQQRDSTPNLTLNHDTVTASLYVKYGNSANIIFGLNDATTNTEYEQTFNFNSGVPVYSSGTNDGTTVTSVGNGWYRLSMRLNLLSRGIKGHSFKGRVTPAGSASASGTYSYVTGFQLESGTQATTYVETPSGTSDTTAPSTPANFSALVSGTSTSLSWSASTDNVGVTGYQILRSTTNGSGYSQIATSNTTSYSDSGLSAGTYYYVVKAYDAAGNTSSNSNQATATITTQSDTIAPSTPTNLSASASGTTISLLWSASTDNIGVARYLVERSTSASSGFTQISTPTTNSYTDSGLANSTTYYYRIRAQDSANNTSSYSSTANATTGSSTPPPSGSVSITGVSGTLSQGQTVTISGSGFGTKNRQQPLMFDNLVQTSGYQGYLQNNTIVPTRGCIESGCEANPQPTNQSLPWYNHTYGGTPRFYIGSSSRYSGHPAYRATNLADNFSTKGFFARNFAVNTAEGWTNLDWWIRSNEEFGQGPGGGVSGKILRLWHDPNIVDQLVLVNMPGPQMFADRGCTVHTGQHIEYISAYPLNQWIHLSVMTKVATSGTEAHVLVNGRLVATVTGFCGNNGIYDYLRMIGLDPSYPEYLASNLEFLWGDIYFDDSLARVILADTPTFNPFGGSSTSHYEMQNVQSWSNGSISVKINPGSFTSGQTAYLYVVDSNGNVNSSGYPITISGVLGTNVSSCNTPDQDTINWTSIPNGTLVRGCGSAIYVIQNNKRVYINSLEVLRNQYPGQRIYNVNNDLLLSYPLAT